MEMKTWMWVARSFHGDIVIRVRVPADSQAGDLIKISGRVARRIKGLFHASAAPECRCGETGLPIGAEIDPISGDASFELPPKGGIIKGRYSN